MPKPTHPKRTAKQPAKAVRRLRLPSRKRVAEIGADTRAERAAEHKRAVAQLRASLSQQRRIADLAKKLRRATVTGERAVSDLMLETARRLNHVVVPTSLRENERHEISTLREEVERQREELEDSAARVRELEAAMAIAREHFGAPGTAAEEMAGL